MKPIVKNDKAARNFIMAVSAIVFIAVVVLSRIKLEINLGFDPHLFAMMNALINSTVSVLLIAALIAIKQKKINLHRNLMFGSIILSVLFLLSYICHHLFTDETPFGGSGAIKTFYYVILISHIILAGIILPFILYTAYRALTAEYDRHKKLAKITWPIWLYVSVTGVLVYLMISPYYGS
jgi:putative membrane protein